VTRASRLTWRSEGAECQILVSFYRLERIVFLASACHDACVVAGQTGWRRVLGRPAIRRVLASATVAGGLGVVFMLVLYIGSRSHVTAGLTCGGEWGCLGLALIGALAGMLAIVVLAWPLLHMAGVRPAWPVALVGPVVALVLSREYGNLTGHTLVTGLWVVLAVSYAAAAVITAPRLYRYWSLVVGLAVIALYLATRSAGGL
jgi:hypothetical protein